MSPVSTGEVSRRRALAAAELSEAECRGVDHSKIDCFDNWLIRHREFRVDDILRGEVDQPVIKAAWEEFQQHYHKVHEAADIPSKVTHQAYDPINERIMARRAERNPEKTH